jgi:GNAT superfamily N-acetyltransferase
MSMVDAPHGLTLALLPDDSGEQHKAARQFCLDVIKEFYGSDYRVDWHADLDSLTLGPEQSWFSARNRGAFWTLSAPDGSLVAAAGLYCLTWKPKLAAALATRYPDPEQVTQLVRVYIRKDQRGRQIGRWLNMLAEAEARRLGFATLYLHASADTAATIGFWRGRGYAEIATIEATTHFDKSLSNTPA